MLHPVVWSPGALPGRGSTSRLPCLWWPWQLWGALWDAPQLEFGLCFLLFILEWWAFGRSHRPSALLITSHEGHVKSACLHCLDFNYLAKVMLDRFLCWKLILSPMFPYCGLWGRKPLCVANRQVEGSYAAIHEGRVSIVHMLLEILLHRSVSFI